MREEFDINLTPKDMYKFNMYHTYHSRHGIFSIIMAIFVFVVAGITWGNVEMTYSVIYLLLGVLFIVYYPLLLWTLTKTRMQKSEALRKTQHFIVDEQGVTMLQEDAQAGFEWKQVYKAVSTKSNLLLYTTRENAYILPRDQIKEHYEPICAIMRDKLEKYRLKIK